MQCGERHLWVRNWIETTNHSWAAAPYRRLRMAGCTAVSVESRPQANALFSIYGADHRIQFREVIERFVEQSLFGGAQAEECVASAGTATTRSGIFLSAQRSNTEDCKETEAKN